MRGGSLGHPDVIEALKPFIVTSWYVSNADFGEMPAELLRLQREAGLRHENNIGCFVLDEKARLVRGFHPWPGPTPNSLGFDKDRMGRHLRAEIEKATQGMKLPEVKKEDRPIKLPDVERGVRIYLKLESRTASWRTPVVETVPAKAVDAQLLAWPREERGVPAEKLKAWLDPIFPPGIMDQGPGTYARIGGTLTLKPAGPRAALLAGDVELVMGDREATTIRGRLEAAFTYEADALKSLRGVFEGNYPRRDRMRGGVHDIRMTAAIESRPD